MKISKRKYQRKFEEIFMKISKKENIIEES